MARPEGTELGDRFGGVFVPIHGRGHQDGYGGAVPRDPDLFPPRDLVQKAREMGFRFVSSDALLDLPVPFAIRVGTAYN